MNMNDECFLMLRCFAKKELSNETILDLLKQHLIFTLQQLKQKSGRMADVFPNDDNSELVDAITQALKQDKPTPKQALCQERIVYDKNCISEECYNMFTPCAVSVHPEQRYAGKGDRHPSFTLVSGPSGSGKTLFAIRQVSKYMFWQNEDQYFRIHFTAKTVTDLMLEDQSLTFAKAVARIVVDVITRILARKGHVGVKTLDIPIHVIIDNAGEECYAQYFATAGKINYGIHEAIKSNVTFEFGQVHVTVVGTRLETSTEDTCLVSQPIRFRMQPWTVQNFDALVTYSSTITHKARVKEVVREFSVLEGLISNARCAYHVLRWMDDASFLDKCRVRDFVPVIVSVVANSYIEQNGLKNLQNNAADKWKVIRSVFLELDKAIRQPKLAFFPEFKDLPTEALRSIGNSLLDFNVQRIDREPRFARGKEYSCSMSPAIAIVLVYILNGEAAISWDWQRFESIVMLSELKQMVVNSQEAPSHQLDKLVLVLKSPVPEADEMMSVSIPEVSRYTVMLNGPSAEYANVIAPYRLVKVRVARNFQNPPKLDLQDELNMMGVTKSPEHKLQRFTTRVYYTMWESREKVNAGTPPPPPLPPVPITRPTANTDSRFQCYPFKASSPRVGIADPAAIVGRYDDESTTGCWTVPDNTFGPGDGVCRAFHDQRPITAIFATNGCKYHFKGNDFTIQPDDVDCDGKLKAKADELPADFQSILKSLLKNVEIRFLFF